MQANRLACSLLLAWTATTPAPAESPELPAGAVVSQFQPATPTPPAAVVIRPVEATEPAERPRERPAPPGLQFPRAGVLERRLLPISLPEALQAASARPIDVMVAARQVQIAQLQYERTRLLWLPNVTIGADYFRHDGSIQNFQGTILKANRSSLMAGVGLNASLGLTDAIFAPLAAGQELGARQAGARAVGNDVTLAVAEAYFNLVQARGDYSAAEQLVREGESLVRITEDLAEGLAPPVEAARTRVELARRTQAAITARERWQVASAELSRLLRLDPGALLDPAEEASLAIPLVDPSTSLDELIRVGLLNRPELAANQALVQATLQRLKAEKLRPLIPSVLLRSVSTNPSGSLGFGVFGGGGNLHLGQFNTRFDYDVQVLWELQNLGFGNRNRVKERGAEHELALLESFRVQDRVAAEVAAAHAQLVAARQRLRIAEPAAGEAMETFRKNTETLTQTRRVGNALVLVSRPQEVVASLQALATATGDYYSAVADMNRAQFRLYRALGHPPEVIVQTAATRAAPEASRADPR